MTNQFASGLIALVTCCVIYTGLAFTVPVQAEGADQSKVGRSSYSESDDLPSASDTVEMLKGRHALAVSVWQRRLLQMEEELANERHRTEALTRDLDVARIEQDRLIQSRGEAADQLAKETERADTLARDLDITRRKIADLTQALSVADAELQKARDETTVSAQRAVPDVEVTGSLPSTNTASAGDQDFISKADDLLKQGNVAGARLVLEHGLRAGGSALLVFTLAKHMIRTDLAGGGSLVSAGDAQKARELYNQAAGAGVQIARERIANLPQ